MTRLSQQLAFIVEIDRLKDVLRRNLVTAGDRSENDAEHSWHLALMAAVLGEYANEDVDVGRVILILLVHDVVEIDAGDAFVYDDDARTGKEERERAAADRIFALLPSDQADFYRGLWDEFEARATPESRFAAAIDRLQPLLLNHATRGASWSQHAITADRVLRLNSTIDHGSSHLWEHAQRMIEDAIAQGYLAPGPVG